MGYENLELKEWTFVNRVTRKIAQKLGSKVARGPVPGGGKAIGVGLIGVGNIARWAYLPALKRADLFRLCAVHDVDAAAARSTAGAFIARACATTAELLMEKDVEAVFVCTPPQAHSEAVLAALEAGKHVLCEKPLAATLGEARAMCQAAQKAKTVHMVNFSFRFRPETAFMVAIIRSGILGKIYHVLGAFSQGGWFTESGEPAQERVDAAAWRYAPGGGVVYELGPHLVDLFRWSLGEVSQVQAWTKQFRPGPSTCEDASGFSLAFQEGPVAHLLTSRWATAYKERMTFEVSGSKGTLVYDDGGTRLWTRDEPRWRNLMVPSPEHPSFLGAFHAAIRGASPGIPTFNDGLRTNEIMEGIFQSAASGKAAGLSSK